MLFVLHNKYDALSTLGARTSAGMVLTPQSRNIPPQAGELKVNFTTDSISQGDRIQP